MEYYKPPSFAPHKVIRTVDGHNIVLQDLDQDLEQHQVGVVANQVTEATMTYPRIAPNQGLALPRPPIELRQTRGPQLQ